MAEKRQLDDNNGNQTSNIPDESDNDVGPMPVESKKKRKIEFEAVYINNLPSAEAYEKSYMHREVITHLAVSKTHFLITGSCDGHIKFWKKQPRGIEFVKHFRTHLGPINDLSVNSTGTLLASISSDKSLKVFDIINFDMINMMRLNYTPGKCEWCHSAGDPIPALAVSDLESGKIYTYDGSAGNTPLHILENLHRHSVVCMKYNAAFSTMISADISGILEYWTSHKNDYKFPNFVNFDSKLDTDLFEFVKNKTYPHDMAFSKDGVNFATLSGDRKVCVFKFLTGKLLRVFDESLQQLSSLHQMKQQLPNMEFGRRMAIERDMEKFEALKLEKITFDESGYFVLYPTMLGIKAVNWYTNKCAKVLGKGENLRALCIALYQSIPNKSKATSALSEASENPALDNIQPDPTLFCTAYKKNRFFIFSQRDPEEATEENPLAERDIFNEKPSREDIIAATDTPVQQRVWEYATIHTTMGDIHCKLFSKECPKSVENFCVHCKNGYYNGHIFHRVIKQFMVQTGDPTGTGTGGESIWGGEFEDEFHPDLKHDKPYTLSMANAGPNTNGSQFFITVVPTEWLDNKHTVFGRVIRGMETVQNISNVKTHPKTDKPYDDISIINISLK